jgi:hypothetical protein
MHFAMKSYLPRIGSMIAAVVLTASAWAAEASPAGLWKWTVQGRQGGQGFEQTLKLDYKDGALTGVLMGSQRGEFSVPDTPIADASFKDGQIKFSVTRELRGQKFTTKYDGKLEGDTIKGSFERPGFNNTPPTKSDWEARRQK